MLTSSTALFNSRNVYVYAPDSTKIKQEASVSQEPATLSGVLVYSPHEYLNPDHTNPYIGSWELVRYVEQVINEDPDRLLFPPEGFNEQEARFYLGDALREKYDCGSPDFSRLSRCQDKNQAVPDGAIYVYKYPNMLRPSPRYCRPGDLSAAQIKQLVAVIKKYDAVMGYDCHYDPEVLAAGICNMDGKKGLMIYDPENAAALLDKYNRKKAKEEREERRRAERRKSSRPLFTVRNVSIFVGYLQDKIRKFLPNFNIYSQGSWRHAMNGLQCALYLSESMFGPHAYRKLPSYANMVSDWKKSQGKLQGKVPAWLIHWLDQEAAIKKPPKTVGYHTNFQLRCKRLPKLQRIPEPSEDTPSEPEQQPEQRLE